MRRKYWLSYCKAFSWVTMDYGLNAFRLSENLLPEASMGRKLFHVLFHFSVLLLSSLTAPSRSFYGLNQIKIQESSRRAVLMSVLIDVNSWLILVFSKAHLFVFRPFLKYKEPWQRNTCKRLPISSPSAFLRILRGKKKRKKSYMW